MSSMMCRALRGVMRAPARPGAFVRAMSSAAAAPPPQQQQESAVSTSIISRYGWLPVAGIASAIAVSKELLIINEELVVLFTFTATVAALYKQIGNTVATSLDERASKIMEELSGVMNRGIESIDEEIKSREEMTGIAEDVNLLYQQYDQLLDRYVKATPNKLQGRINEQITNRLSIVAEKERQLVDGMRTLMADGAALHVAKQFAKEGPPLSDTIRMLTGGGADTKDPVREQFADYFRQFNKKVTSSAGKSHTLDADQKKEWAEAFEDLVRRDPALKGIDVSAPSTVKL